MIRKTIIVILTLPAIALLALILFSFHRNVELGEDWVLAEEDDTTPLIYIVKPPPYTKKWIIQTRQSNYRYSINDKSWMSPYYGMNGWCRSKTDETLILIHEGYCTVYIQRQIPNPKLNSKRSYGGRWLSFENGDRPTLHQGGHHRYWGFHVTLAIPLVLLVTFPTIAFIRGPMRCWRRRRKGLCIKCGYNLTGNTSGTCPECGKPINEK